MSLFVVAGYMLDRESGVFQGLVLAGLAILIENPSALFQPGFQMSFLAASGIVIALSNWKIPSNLNRFTGNLAGIALVTFFAQSGLYPLLALYFHRISLVSLVSNIILVPYATLLMCAGCLSSFIYAFSGWVPQFSAACINTTNFLISGFRFAVEFFAGLPYAAVWVVSPGAGMYIAYYSAVFILWHFPDKNFRKKIIAPLAMLAVSGLVMEYSIPPQGNIFLFSKGRSRCILVKTPEDRCFLFNAGIDGAVLANAVLGCGTRRIEALVLSDLMPDSWRGIGGLAGVIDIRAIFMPYGAAGAKLRDGAEGIIKKGAVIKAFWPGESLAAAEYKINADWPLWKGYGGISRRDKGYSGWPGHDGLSWRLSGRLFSLETGADIYSAVFNLKNGRGDSAPFEFDIISRDGAVKSLSFSKEAVYAQKN